MDKQNIFRSCSFHTDSGDIVHILVKDLVGVMPTIELVDEDDDAEDAYIPILETDYFIITVDTTKAGSANNTFVLPTTGSGYDCNIDWGDGTALENQIGTPGNVTHVYAASGTYHIKISGTFPQIYFNNGGDKLKLITIDQWGNIQWSSMEKAFYGCSNMQGNWVDAPVLSGVTDLSFMFGNCSKFNFSVLFTTSSVVKMNKMFSNCFAFNQSVASFDTSNVTDMATMFGNCFAFNQSVANFDTAKVQNMSFMLSGCWVFNQSVANFVTSEVTNMRGMFASSSVFNQSVTNFDTQKVTDMSFMFTNCSAFNQSVANFNTSLVQNMDSMFLSCFVFNQSLASFDTSEVTSMNAMFYDCNAFNQSVANFDTSKVTNMFRMFDSAAVFKQSLATFNLSSIIDGVTGGVREILLGIDVNAPGTSANYDNTLIAWAAADVPNGLTLHGGNSKYGAGAGATARASLIADDTWTIIDGGVL